MADNTVLITPFVRPDSLGLPVGSWLDGFRGERCRDTPRQLSIPLDTAEPDAIQIIRHLQKLSLIYGRNPCVIAFARCLVEDIATNNDTARNLSRVADFMAADVVYLADPRGIEFVRSPVQLLADYERNGFAKGDCDDMTLLGNSLFLALGFPVRTVAVKIHGSELFNHVFTSVHAGGRWMDFDACRKEDPWAPHEGERAVAV